MLLKKVSSQHTIHLTGTVFPKLGIDIGYIHEKQTVVPNLRAVDSENTRSSDQRTGRADTCGIVSYGLRFELELVFLGYVYQCGSAPCVNEENTGPSVHSYRNGYMTCSRLENREDVVAFSLHDTVIGSRRRNRFRFSAPISAAYQKCRHEDIE